MRFRVILFGSVLTIASAAAAQLPADPWANQSPLADKQQIGYLSYAQRNTLINEPLPNFVGQNTTWGTAMGQEMIAPDVNITNMLLMTQHLRKLGYQIPDGLDAVINTAPARLRRDIMNSLIELQRSSNPVAVASMGYAKLFEKHTGFSIENLITNSLRIIDERR